MRKASVLIVITLLCGLESVYFARQFAVGYLQLRGRSAFFGRDLHGSWNDLQHALEWGGSREEIETDLVELLIFGLLQEEIGVEIDAPLSREQALHRARTLISGRLDEAPYRAYHWAYASDIYLYESRIARRAATLDLSSLSEDPLENLNTRDVGGLIALSKAAALEPNNYAFHDLVTEFFLDIGSPGLAAGSCRRAVAIYPKVSAHVYLSRAALPAEILEAAIDGFEDALKRTSIISTGDILFSAGHLLWQQGNHERAIYYLSKAVDLMPRDYGARILLGRATFRLEFYERALVHFLEASELNPKAASPYYYIGSIHRALGQIPAALKAFRQARKLGDSRRLRFFYALGETLEADGQFHDAERQFVAAANLNAGSAAAWSTLLRFYLRRDDERGVARACKKLVALAPDHRLAVERCDTDVVAIP